MSPLSEPLRSGGAFTGLPSLAMLKQALLRTLAPAADGLILGEEYGIGSRRNMLPGRCVKLDATDDTINMGNVLAITGVITLAAWVNPDTVGTARYIINKGAGAGQQGYKLRTDTTNKIWFSIGNGGQRQTGALGTIPIGAWTHVVGTYDGTTMRIYINGSLSYSSDVEGGGITADSNVLRIGAQTASGMLPFEGKVSDVQIFESVLTDSEVFQLYALGCNALPGKQRGGWWKLDEQHPTLAYDSSGNGYHGTITSANATVGNFFYEGADVPHSYPNDKGYGVEKNLLPYSENFADAAWIKTNCTIGSNVIANPRNGAITGDALIPVTGSASSAIKRAPVAPGTGSTITYSGYLKKGGLGDWVEVTGENINGASARAWVNLALLTKGTVSGWASLNVQDVGGGWCRFDVTGTLSSSGTNVYVSPRSGNGSTGAITGDGSTPYLYVDALQVEVGSIATVYESREAAGFDGLASTLIPRNESDKTKSVTGRTLTYTGRCPRNAQLVQSNCYTSANPAYIDCGTLSGTFHEFSCRFYVASAITSATSGTSLIQLSTVDNLGCIMFGNWTGGLTGEVISMGEPGAARRTGVLNITIPAGWHTLRVYWDGTQYQFDLDGVKQLSVTESTHVTLITLSNPRIGVRDTGQVFNGQLCDVKIKTDATTTIRHYPMAEGAGDKIHDVANGQHATLISANLVTCWANKQSVCHYNTLNGHTKYLHATLSPLYVPYSAAGVPTVITPPTGYTRITDYPAGKFHDMSESRIDFTQGAASPGSAGVPTAWHPSEPSRNLLKWSTDLTNAVWVKSTLGTGSLPVVTPGFIGPTGQSAFRVQATRGAGTAMGDYGLVTQGITGLPNPHTISLGCWMKSNDGTSQEVFYRTSSNGNPPQTATVTPEWQYFSHSYTSPFTVAGFQFGSRGSASSASVDILICEPQLVYGSEVTEHESTQSVSASTSLTHQTFARKSTKSSLHIATDRVVSYSPVLAGTRLAATQRFSAKSVDSTADALLDAIITPEQRAGGMAIGTPRLFGSYSGPPIRLRRGGDSVEADSGAGTSRVSSDAVIAHVGKNLLPYSEDMTPSPPNWVYSAATNVPAPGADGAMTATKLVENTANTAHHLRAGRQTEAIPLVVTYSFWAKAAGRNALFVQMQAEGGYPKQSISLVDGSLLNSITQYTTKTESQGNGWWKISVSCATTLGAAACVIGLVDASGNTQYVGDGVSGVVIWHPQLEYGNTATEYEARTTTGASPCLVPKLYDQLGSNHAVQNTGTQQPQIIPRQIGERPVLSFDGVDDKLEIASPGLSGAGDRTIALWIKPNALVSRSIWSMGATGTGTRFDCVIDASGRLRIECGGASYATSYTISGTQYTHVAVVLSGGNFEFSKVYANGVLAGTATGNSLALSITDAPFRLGAPVAAGYTNFSGAMGGTLVLKNALSAARILAIKQATQAEYGL